MDAHLEGDAVIVEVSLIPTGKGLSGKFVADISLDAATRIALFGKHPTQIWCTAEAKHPLGPAAH